MDQTPPPPPLPPSPAGPERPAEVERCYRHPDAETRVHCTRCDRPICPACMIAAPVGHQCPECVGKARAEFRRDPSRVARSTARGLSVTKVLMALILLGFLAELVLGGPQSLLDGPDGETMVELGAMFPPFVALNDQYWRFFTSMFLHFGLIHLGFNAYALWMFGRVVERDFGKVRFTLIYFIGGFIAGVASYALGPPVVVAAGASGAIFAIFGAFIAYNYRRRHLAAAAQNLRAAIFLVLINGLLAFTIPGIDWRAHAGGFVAGLVAGVVADEVGDPRYRRWVQVLGFVALAAAGVAVLIAVTPGVRDEILSALPALGALV